jgi:glycosyltransferase involved in cell wall biosynthesis
MPCTSTTRPIRVEAERRPLALAVADANWYTTEHLFGEVRRPGVSTLLLKCLDYYNAWQRGGLPWSWGVSLAEPRAGLWRRELVLPSGWMKSFPSWGMRPIRRTIESWRDRHAAGGPLALVMTYPHYLFLRDQLRPDYQVYFNIDDYSQYWPRRAATVHALERQAVREADLTVCVSRLRCEELRRAVPEAAGRVRHLPHGAPAATLAERPQYAPASPPDDLRDAVGPRLGYVGTLEDRVDWPLLTRLADALPSATIVLLGRMVKSRRMRWQADCRRCLARPNVRAIGWRPQESLGGYIRSFDVCLIPYAVDHPFNRVCCPTKIMDYMGSGRPIVSTDLPECRLHHDRFAVAASADEFIARVADLLAHGEAPHRAEARHAFARDHTCSRVAERFLDWLIG